MRGKLFLIHWNPPLAEQMARELRAAEWRVDFESEDSTRAVRRIREQSPNAIVISLARSPSYGVETAHALRAMRVASVPIVFVDGKADTIKEAKARVPMAIFATSGELSDVLAMYAKFGWG